MTTITEGAPTERAERTFLLTMAAALALTAAAGFGSFALRGMVVQPIPIHVHVHAGLFVAWLALFVTQATLVRNGAMAVHRGLGWFALALAVAMLGAGWVTATESVRLGRVPPFFPDNIFLALSFLELATFAVLLAAAILLRGQSDWHRRLMLGATIALIGPAWGRLLPMPLLGPMGGLAVMGAQFIYLFVAMGFDLRHRKSFHPAYFLVAGMLLTQGIFPPLLGGTPAFAELASALAPR